MSVVMGGILTKDELLSAVKANELVTGCSCPEERIRGCSLDLTVGTIFWEGDVVREVSQTPKQVIIPPGGVVGIFTSEELILPDNMCATAFAINEMSSKGFLVLNPGHVDPGFSGALTVKALNVRKTSIAISQGEPIFTVIFQRLGASTESYRGNSSRSERERRFNAETVQSSPRTIASMIEFDRDGPFPSRAEVKELVRTDAINRATLLLSMVAAFASVCAVVLAIRPTGNTREQAATNAPVMQSQLRNILSAEPKRTGANRGAKLNGRKEEPKGE